MRVEDVPDGQIFETPSGRKGRIVNHAVRDGVPILRIQITNGKLMNIWSTFNQRELDEGKISNWLFE